jgi:hypothetical protein
MKGDHSLLASPLIREDRLTVREPWRHVQHWLALLGLAQNAQDFFFGRSFLRGPCLVYPTQGLSFQPLQFQGYVRTAITNTRCSVSHGRWLRARPCAHGRQCREGRAASRIGRRKPWCATTRACGRANGVWEWRQASSDCPTFCWPAVKATLFRPGGSAARRCNHPSSFPTRRKIHCACRLVRAARDHVT